MDFKWKRTLKLLTCFSDWGRLYNQNPIHTVEEIHNVEKCLSKYEQQKLTFICDFFHGIYFNCFKIVSFQIVYMYPSDGSVNSRFKITMSKKIVIHAFNVSHRCWEGKSNSLSSLNSRKFLLRPSTIIRNFDILRNYKHCTCLEFPICVSYMLKDDFSLKGSFFHADRQLNSWTHIKVFKIINSECRTGKNA